MFRREDRNGIPGFPAGGRQVADLGGTYSDGRVTGKAALNWQVDPDNLIYAFAARGYKAGGFNSATSRFGPETVWDYEIGWKSTFLDRHIRTQIGAYYNDYNNFQFGDVDLTTGQTGQLRNLSNAVVKGFEGQVQGKFGGFGFDGGVAYVDSKLSSVTVVNTRLLPAGTLGPQCAAGVPSNPPTCFNYAPFIVNNSGGPQSLFAEMDLQCRCAISRRDRGSHVADATAELRLCRAEFRQHPLLARHRQAPGTRPALGAAHAGAPWLDRPGLRHQPDQQALQHGAIGQ